jgi:hypothetical protein
MIVRSGARGTVQEGKEAQMEITFNTTGNGAEIQPYLQLTDTQATSQVIEGLS